jgi:glycerol uptake facilitator-like aquaporin
VQDIRKASVAEFVGTFALIFFGAGSTILRASGELDLVGVALAHGLIVATPASSSSCGSPARHRPSARSRS